MNIQGNLPWVSREKIGGLFFDRGDNSSNKEDGGVGGSRYRYVFIFSVLNLYEFPTD